MARSLIAVSAILVTIASARGDLNLNPSRGEYLLEGMKFEQLIFWDGLKKVSYAPPRGWKFSGSPDRFLLYPPGKSTVEASITRTILAQPYSLDEAVTKKLTETALGSVPGGSTSVTVIGQEKNAFMLGGNESLLITLSYTLGGERCKRSVMFLNRGKEQLRFQFSSREVDFDELEGAFKRSHLTWQNL